MQLARSPLDSVLRIADPGPITYKALDIAPFMVNHVPQTACGGIKNEDEEACHDQSRYR